MHLTDMDITRVSLVDKGANEKRIAVLKRQEGPMGNAAAGAAADTSPSGLAGLLRKAADAVLGKVPIAKVQTFASMVAGQELQEALGESWWTLQDALWAAIYATDDNGADLSLEAKQALVGQDLDEFKAYLLAEMGEATQIGKRATNPDAESLAGLVAKVGRKISGSRLERLQTAADALSSVLTEVNDTDNQDDEEDTDVDKAEITKAVSEAMSAALEPVIKRIDDLEATKVEKTDSDDAPVTLEVVAEAIGKIGDRLEKLETAGAVGKRTSIAGQDGGEVKKRAAFAGLF